MNVRSSLALALLTFTAVSASCAKEDYTRLYLASSKAPSLDPRKIEALDHLGPSLIDNGVNFGVYSERASRIELLLFDDPESIRPSRQFPLERFGDVWNVHIEGVGEGQAYGFIAWGPNWGYDPSWYPGSIAGFQSDVDAEGNRFNPNKLLQDPYAKALHRDHDWMKGNLASGPKRNEVTYAAASKSLVVQSNYQWGAEESRYREKRQDPEWRGHRWNEQIIYEVHLKGFTASRASGVSHPGTYRGLAEKADYFKELGVTAVELLPIHEKPLDGGYWGYQTLNFFAPELTYASRRERAEVIDEFKLMVEALHQRGIEVYVDVVYNHTGEGGLWREKIQQDASPATGFFDASLSNLDPKEVAGLYSYRGFDNAAYYALDPSGQTYWNNTGVGNQTRPNHRPMRRLIMDSLRYYVEEFHVDGFRFDLAPILGETDLNYNKWDNPANTVLQDIIDDPVLQKYNTRIIAEPWSATGAYEVPIGKFPNSSNQPGNGWYEWNGRFRDWWRSFVNDDNWRLNSTEVGDGGFLMTGSDGWYKHNGRRPYHSVNFVTVHDGFTLYDVFTYGQKRNKCGPLNPICCDAPFSSFCDRDSGESHNRSRDWGGEPAQEVFKRQLMRNLFVAMMFSHGTPMILGGDEWMRTQLGNNNAYSTRADNEFNWFDWGAWEAAPFRHRMKDFVAQTIRMRKERFYAFAPDDYGKSAPFAWKTPQNQPAQPADWGKKSIMIHYYDPTQGPELLVLINMENAGVDFQLPAGRTWRRLVDTQQTFDFDDYVTRMGGDPRRSLNVTLDAPVPVPGSVYGSSSRTIVILEAGKSQ
jgi:isoamylase